MQLALALFQVDLAVKQEVEKLPEQEEEHLLPGGLVGVKRLHNHGHGRRPGRRTYAVDHPGQRNYDAGMHRGICPFPYKACKSCGAGRMAILTGGALSNLYERCRNGYVVDYIRFHSPWKRLNRLVFNLADFFIFIGSALIVLGKKD